MQINHTKNDRVYFASRNPDETAQVLLAKADQWFNQMTVNGYLEKIKQTWSACHGCYYSGFTDSHMIQFGGEQGELSHLAVNHIRSISDNIINMITAARPSLQCRAINTDNISLVQARLGNNILDYYMREKKLEDYIRTAVKLAVQMASGYIKLEWNANIGDEYDYDEENDYVIRNGDIQFNNLSPFDVFFDNNNEYGMGDWVLTRSPKNRFDIIAKYPEFEDEILAIPTTDQLLGYNYVDFHMNQTDNIYIYEFYHKRTESMPNGRYMMFLNREVQLLDVEMPYRDLPVYRIAGDLITGTPYGYTILFELLPLQDATNALYSTILTNQSTFGVQNVLVPRGADISMSQLAGGLNIIEANTQAGEIRPLNLTQTPQEIFTFIQMLEKSMETISGMNSIARGNVQATDLKSGTALAMMQSIAIQTLSGLQTSYVKFIEDLGMGVLNILKDHAKLPRIVTISGIKNKTSAEKFVGDDVKNVNRVIVDIGNALSSTVAGRTEMAEQMLQMGAIKTPDQYFTVINTGRLDSMTENVETELLNIRDENERLVNGKTVVAIALDDHRTHIMEHKGVLADSELRLKPDLVQRVMEHINEHVELLRTVDPDLLNIVQQQPLGPQGGSPTGQQPPAGPQGGPQGQTPASVQAPTAAQQTGAMPANMPNLPTPPAPFDNAAISPEQQLPG
jgi:hypothetical protein